MVYAMSDLHGCFDKYKKMLEIIDLKPHDTLYILGDVVDRGKGSIEILKDMKTHANIIPLRGNHDYMAYCLLKKYSASPVLQKALHDENAMCKMLSQEGRNQLENALTYAEFTMWVTDGGDVTVNAFLKESKESQREILNYIDSFLIFDETEVSGKKFFLSHTVPEKEKLCDKEKWELNDFIYGEPEFEKEYFPDKFIVTGHTPTAFIDQNYKGRIYMKNNHIAIDCGAVFGNPLGCICLDTMEEFYAN